MAKLLLDLKIKELNRTDTSNMQTYKNENRRSTFQSQK